MASSVDIKYKPKDLPKVGAIKKGSEENEYDVEWNYSSWSISEKNKQRIQGCYVKLKISFFIDKKAGVGQRGWGPYKKKSISNAYLTDIIRRSWFATELVTQVWYTYTSDGWILRQPYLYPLGGTGKTYMGIKSIQYILRPYNSKGTNSKTVTSPVYKFAAPNKPTITEPYIQEVNGALTYKPAFDIEVNKTDPVIAKNGVITEKPIYGTSWSIDYIAGLYNTKGKIVKDKQKVLSSSGIIRDDSFTALATVPLNRIGTLADGEYIDVIASAWTMGFGGKSAIATKKRRFSRPFTMSIKSIKPDSNNTDTTRYVNITVSYPVETVYTKKTDAKTKKVSYEATGFMVDTITLQRLSNTDITTAAEAAVATGWNDVETLSGPDVFRSKTTADKIGFSEPYSATNFERGKRTWYRIKTTREPFTDARYGVPVFAKSLYQAAPTSSSTTVSIVSADPNADGTGINVILGWNNPSSVKSIEVSWSEFDDAWESNQGPSTMEVDWYDQSPRVSGYSRTARVSIRGLYDGTPYYIKARTRDTSDLFGSYATPSENQYPIAPVTTPTNIQITVPQYATRGDDIEILWTFEGDEQREWKLYRIETEDDGHQTRVEVAQGTDASGATNYLISEDESSNVTNISFIVAVSCGSDWGYSNEGVVQLATRPELRLFVDPIMTAQMPTYRMLSTQQNIGLSLQILSEGFNNGSMPDDKIRMLGSGENILSLYSDTDITWDNAISLNSTVTQGWDTNLFLLGTLSTDDSGNIDVVTWFPFKKYYNYPLVLVSYVKLYRRVGENLYVELTEEELEGIDFEVHLSSDPSYIEIIGYSMGFRIKVNGSLPYACDLGVFFDENDENFFGSGQSSIVQNMAQIDSVYGFIKASDILESAGSESIYEWTEDLFDIYELLEASDFDLYYQDDSGDLHSGAPNWLNSYLVEASSESGHFSASIGVMVSSLEQHPNSALIIATSYEDGASKAPGTYFATLSIPYDEQIYDKASYHILATAGDLETGLVSDTVDARFEVDFAHKPSIPHSSVSLVTANASKSVMIKAEKPEGGLDTDLIDIYRVTPGGVDLIAENISYGTEVIDRYAPYSKTADLRYRVACRTADGAMDWNEFPYDLPGYQIRFDWDEDRYLELPYNIRYSDNFSKAFEARDHMDGTTSGYWNENVSHEASLSTDLVRLSDPEQIEAVMELANYSGPVFVRTPNGMAYQANVDVTSIDMSYDSLVLKASFKAKEIMLTDAFRPGAENINEPTDTEEAGA